MALHDRLVGLLCGSKGLLVVPAGPATIARTSAARARDCEHLHQAIDRWEGFRDMAKGDSDFDPIRDEPAFEELIGR